MNPQQLGVDLELTSLNKLNELGGTRVSRYFFLSALWVTRPHVLGPAHFVSGACVGG